MTASRPPTAPAGSDDGRPGADRLVDDRPLAAVFVDVENMASGPALDDAAFEVARIMTAIEAMARPVLRRAYADWGRLRDLRAAFLRHGFDQIQTTYVNATKNALDMQLSCDAMEQVLTGPHVDVVVLVTGDGDFGPLARSLRRHGPLIVGIGWAEKTSDSLRAHCDRFLDYDDLPPAPAVGPAQPRRPAQAARAPRERRMIPMPADADERHFLYDPRDDGAAAESGDEDGGGGADPPVERARPPRGRRQAPGDDAASDGDTDDGAAGEAGR